MPIGNLLLSGKFVRDGADHKKEIKVGRHAAYLIKLSKRIFELFTVRGLSNLYAATYITPSHLIQLDDDDFNRILLTKAQEFKMKEIEMEIGE